MKCFFILGFTIRNAETIFEMIDFSTFTMYVGKTKLKQNRDYIVSYSQNKKVGTAVITIIGKGNYSGTVKKYFEIKK